MLFPYIFASALFAAAMDRMMHTWTLEDFIYV